MHDRISVNSNCLDAADSAQFAGLFDELGVRRISMVGAFLEADPAAARRAFSGRFRMESIVHGFLRGRGLDAEDDETWSDAQDRLSRLIDLGVELGARSIYMGTGARGRLTWETAAERFRQAISPCVAKAKSAGLSLMIENTPALYADYNIVHSLRDTAALAEMAGIGVCIDLFGCWTEAGLRETLGRAVARSDLLQISDYVLGDRTLPGRAVPGDGVIPLQQLVEWALEAGYAGPFELELTGPRIAQEGRLAATRRASDRLGEMLVALGA